MSHFVPNLTEYVPDIPPQQHLYTQWDEPCWKPCLHCHCVSPLSLPQAHHQLCRVIHDQQHHQLSPLHPPCMVPLPQQVCYNIWRIFSEASKRICGDLVGLHRRIIYLRNSLSLRLVSICRTKFVLHIVWAINGVQDKCFFHADLLNLHKSSWRPHSYPEAPI